MIRLFLSIGILAAVSSGYAQPDTSVRKSGDTLMKTSDTTILNVVQTDTVMKTYESIPVKASKTRVASDEVYKLNLAVDIPLTAVTAGWSLFAFPKISGKGRRRPGKESQ